MPAKWPRRLLWLVLLSVLGLGGWAAGWQLWAEYHLRAARRDCDARHFEAAREHLAICLRVRPNSYTAQYLASRTARRAGDFLAAEDHIDHCHALRGVTPEVQLERALLQVQQGDVESLIPQLRTLVEDGHPDKLLILEAVALGYVRAHRVDEALGCLRRWLEFEPDDTTALAMRARLYDQNKNHQVAINDYEHILQVDGENDAARFGLANALLAFKQPKEAFAHFQILKDRDYPKPDVLAGLARCHQEFGEIDVARHLYDALLVQFPDHAPALTERAKLGLADKNTEEAESLLRRALQHDPAYREAHYTLYLCLKQAGKEEEAARQNEKRKQVEADLTRLFELMNRDIPHDPRNPDLMYEVAMICTRNSEPAGALYWLRRALRYDPNHRPSHQALADHFEKVGQQQQAEDHRRLASPDQTRPKEADRGAAK